MDILFWCFGSGLVLVSILLLWKPRNPWNRLLYPYSCMHLCLRAQAAGVPKLQEEIMKAINDCYSFEHYVRDLGLDIDGHVVREAWLETKVDRRLMTLRQARESHWAQDIVWIPDGYLHYGVGPDFDEANCTAFLVPNSLRSRVSLVSMHLDGTLPDIYYLR